MQHKPKIPWIFYALVFYVFMQFIWWEVLLARQSKQLAEERKKIIALNIADKNELERNLQQIDAKQKHQLWMHIGEGTVFLVLLSLGVLKIYTARRKEIELARLQNNFLLSVTHELKSPLAAVKLQLQTLQKHKLDEATREKLLQKALSDNERLLRIIDNILLASRTKEEKPVLQLKEIELGAFLASLVNQSFEDSKERIHIKKETEVRATVDEQVLSLIISNLIENALKYSPANEIIELVVEPKSIQVKDRGIGIAPEARSKIFDKFYRIGNEQTRNTKGTGLGLYIVKTLSELHGFVISAEQNQPQGSIFRLQLKAE